MSDTLSGEHTMKMFLIGISIGLLYAFSYMIYDWIKGVKNERNSKVE